MNVISLLPYLVEHFEAPNTTCSEVAEHIAQVCYWLPFYNCIHFCGLHCRVKYVEKTYRNIQISLTDV